MRGDLPGKGGGPLRRKAIQRPVHKGERTLALSHGGLKLRQSTGQHRDMDLGKKLICLKDLWQNKMNARLLI